MRCSLAIFAALSLCGAACSKETGKPTPPAEIVAKGPELRAASIAGQEVSAHIKQQLTLAAREGRRLVVYVGASWCEPCHDWHNAVRNGTTGALPAVRFLEFDLDKDGEALARAGYRTNMVPYFALPNEDGTAAGAHFAGVRKGGSYVSQIREQLSAMLAGP